MPDIYYLTIHASHNTTASITRIYAVFIYDVILLLNLL